MRRRIILGALALVVVGVWANNSSLFADTSGNKTKVLAHRGVYQTFPHEDLENDTCTAALIDPPTHAYFENTIPSMQAAFAAGADMVELDVHLTPDNRFAVFHDWTLDCRTDGQGVTEETPMAEMKKLDIAYGYTADGGQTYPFRGQGVGMMPTLSEVLDAFPDGKFLVNYKSRRTEEGTELVSLLDAHPDWQGEVYGVYGGTEPTEAVRQSALALPGYDKQSIVSCLVTYLALGWSGYVPPSCANGVIVVPANYAWLMWGWPHRFTQRMHSVGSDVFLVGPFDGGFTNGIDSPDQVSMVPEHFDGFVWTNKVQQMATLIHDRSGG